MNLSGKFGSVILLVSLQLGVMASAAVRAAVPMPPLRPAPPFLLEDMQGEYHRLMDYEGKVVIVNFWASWCAPCREELPSMNRAWAELKDEPVAMLAINVSDDREAIFAFLRDYPIDFTLLLDTHGRASRHWRVQGLPTTYIVNPGGRVVHRLVGKHDWSSDRLLQLVRDQKRPEP